MYHNWLLGENQLNISSTPYGAPRAVFLEQVNCGHSFLTCYYLVRTVLATLSSLVDEASWSHWRAACGFWKW